MARLTFSNVPTAGGGVVSGNISIGSGSPFAAGGKYGAQVADIQSTIASAPAGTYDPQYWDQFLNLDPETPIPKGFEFVSSDDPRLINRLQSIPQARTALQNLANMLPFNHRWSQEQVNAERKKKISYQNEIALHMNQIMMEENAPLIKAIEDQQRQQEIDQAVKLALEQKIRETATPTPTPTPSDVITDPISPVSYLPFAVVGIVLVVILLFLRRRA